jgi:pimeloyl-ACP methyl ester carboxylesterase
MDAISQRPLDVLTLDEMCDLVRDPSQSPRLEEYFGADYFRDVSTVLRNPPRGVARGSKGTIVLLHGIMGSQIGKKSRGAWDIVWLNPWAIQGGDMSDLALVATPSRYCARGLVPLFYTLLWARLKYWYGFKLVEFSYDWRTSVQEGSEKLVDLVAEETEGPVYLVAHSMGGLVARAALPKLDSRVEKVIQLATPNYGSFQPVVTMRGQNEWLNKILALDGRPIASLISEVLSTFQGLYELMPAPKRFSGVDLFNAQMWPDNPQINADILAKAKTAIEQLPDPDNRFVLIAGSNQDTVTGMTRAANGEFSFTNTNEGDGTVPLDFARFDPSANVPTYLANVTHNGIIADGKVAAAINDLLTKGTTDLSSDSRIVPRRRAVPRPLDIQRASNPFQGRKGKAISASEVRQSQREVLGPLQPDGGSSGSGGGNVGLAGAPGSSDQGFKGVVVGRRRRKLRLVLAKGNITKVPAHAHVLGVFEAVTPSGPVHDYDTLLAGAVTDLFARRMFSGARGGVYLLPTYKSPATCELLAFAGLGSFQDFSTDVVELAAGQVIESLLRSRVNELATVIFGGASSGASQNLYAMLRGFIAGLKEADTEYDFHRIILCELDGTKYKALQKELYRLASSELFNDVEIEFDTLEIPVESEDAQRTRLVAPSGQEPAYLISNLNVNAESDGNDTTYHHEISILPPSSGTTFPRFVKEFTKSQLDEFVGQVENGAPSNLDDYGSKLAKLILPDEFGDVSALLSAQTVQVLHDALSSRIPWESVKFGNSFPAIEKGLSRKYQRTRATAMVSNSRRLNQVLKVLLVYNPTGDLPGAEEEGKAILAAATNSNGKIRVTTMHGSEATQQAILARLGGNELFDIMHYAGHGIYVDENPSQSGLYCADKQVLNGRDLEPLGTKLPPVIIFNACQTGRVRKRGVPAVTTSAPASAAESILNAGIMCFIATYWPVSDRGAGTFSTVFYGCLLSGLKPGATGVTMGEAVLVARKKLKQIGEDDWANYMLYGNPDFVLKQAPSIG